MKFRVEGLYEIDARPVVLARQLEGGQFDVLRSTSPQLGGVPIRHFAEEVSRLRPDGDRDVGVFAFALEYRQDKGKFSVGQIMELDS